MKDKIAVFIATWFYSGFISFVLPGGVPGTYGGFYASLLTIPLCYIAVLVTDIGTALAYWVIVLLIFILGLWSIPRAEAVLGPMMDWRGGIKTHDQNQIAIDEAFGMFISCCPLVLFRSQSLLLGIVLAFFLFRFFDTVKIPPINLLDRIENAAGVMLDDFMAGIYAALVLLLLLLTAGL
jgi:phosphatidylglycerophosphatase A